MITLNRFDLNGKEIPISLCLIDGIIIDYKKYFIKSDVIQDYLVQFEVSLFFAGKYFNDLLDLFNFPYNKPLLYTITGNIDNNFIQIDSFDYDLVQVKPIFSKETDNKGCPIRIQVDLSFETSLSILKRFLNDEK